MPATFADGARSPEVRPFVADVVIVGTGFAGLGMAVKLKAAGYTSFILIERATDVGGTWRDNRYPGCACDIPSRLYSFSFERADSSREFPTQPEIYGYLRRVAAKHRLRRHIRFNVALAAAEYDEPAAGWRLTMSDGSTLQTRVLISAMGGLSEPHTPHVAGLERFKGKVFHSAEWDRDFDLRGRNVAVIGTGASAVQFVPQIAPLVARLSLFQRTPPWILPKPDGEVSRLQRRLLRVPFYGWSRRKVQYWIQESRALGFVVDPQILAALEKLATRYIERQISDPRLRALLKPQYAMGCKRILLSNDYYPALGRGNVELVTSPIAEVCEAAIVSADGVRRPLDAIIFGTGFRATEPLGCVRIAGRDGLELRDAWKDGAAAYLGMSVAGFPNFFMLSGPNTGLGHNSMVFMIEAQVRYVLSALGRILNAKRTLALDVKPSVQAAFNAALQRRMATTVWKSGCRSWYLDENGKNTVLWPGFTFSYLLRTLRMRAQRYDVVRPPLGVP